MTEEIKTSFIFDYQLENNNTMNFKTHNPPVKETEKINKEKQSFDETSDETSVDSNENITSDKKINENEKLIDLYGAEVFSELAKLDSKTIFHKKFLIGEIDSKAR